MAASAKFSVGAAVNHPAGTDDSGSAFPAGTGTVESVSGNAKDGFTYKIRCDSTNKVLGTAFKESDLSAV